MPNFSESLPVPWCDVTVTCVSPEHISLSKKVLSLPGIGETHITVMSQILDNGGNRVGSPADRY